MFGQRDDSNKAGQDQAGAPALPQMTPIAMPTGPIMPTAPINPAAPEFSSAVFGAPVDIPQVAGPAAPISVAPAMPASTNTVPSFSSAAADVATSNDDLARMKQDALQHLQPLVDNLQQSPEEEFRTIMMMIQATDDKTMLKKALEAAKKIGDDKVRAQAMLDVINEINYFAQTSEQE